MLCHPALIRGTSLLRGVLCGTDRIFLVLYSV
jgi:hypothetical protein